MHCAMRCLRHGCVPFGVGGCRLRLPACSIRSSEAEFGVLIPVQLGAELTLGDGGVHFARCTVLLPEQPPQSEKRKTALTACTAAPGQLLNLPGALNSAGRAQGRGGRAGRLSTSPRSTHARPSEPAALLEAVVRAVPHSNHVQGGRVAANDSQPASLRRRQWAACTARPGGGFAGNPPRQSQNDAHFCVANTPTCAHLRKIERCVNAALPQHSRACPECPLTLSKVTDLNPFGCPAAAHPRAHPTFSPQLAMQALAAPRLMRATARLSASRPLAAKAAPLLQKHALVSTPLVSQQRSSNPASSHAHCPLQARSLALHCNR